ncbi:ORF404 [White spot syndrome virus]|uniref:ORF404 n=1 Tax=White spot syndrome virus TaxID=342409 RepID=A0A2D3I6B3_9VIRU|nr:ORF404 [White spot syndrome virus]
MNYTGKLILLTNFSDIKTLCLTNLPCSRGLPWYMTLFPALGQEGTAPLRMYLRLLPRFTNRSWFLTQRGQLLLGE